MTSFESDPQFLLCETEQPRSFGETVVWRYKQGMSLLYVYSTLCERIWREVHPVLRRLWQAYRHRKVVMARVCSCPTAN